MARSPWCKFMRFEGFLSPCLDRCCFKKKKKLFISLLLLWDCFWRRVGNLGVCFSGTVSVSDRLNMHSRARAAHMQIGLHHFCTNRAEKTKARRRIIMELNLQNPAHCFNVSHTADFFFFFLPRRKRLHVGVSTETVQHYIIFTLHLVI